MRGEFVITFVWIALAGCAIGTDDDESSAELSSLTAAIPARGDAATLDIGEWNLEWFGSTTKGPTNDALQVANVRDVILGADLDVWALEEVVSKSRFDELLAQLPGYEGLLANDPSVAGGSSYYSSDEQKVGILFKSSALTVHDARLVVTSNSNDFGGRPPLELDVAATVAGTTLDLTIIVLHAKAMGDSESYQRRLSGSVALQAYLDSAHATDRVLVVGDFNDDVDQSIAGPASPYKNFVDDVARYSFPTKALSDAHQRTISSGSQTIDHHLITNELAPYYIAGSAEVFRVDPFVPSYSSTTTDHYPTITRYSLGANGQAQLIINEILANEPAGDVAAEAVEIVNIGDGSADLGGYTLADATSVRHVFAAGTLLPPGRAIVVFGGAAGIPPGVPNGVAASTGALSLGNTGDTITLTDAGDGELDSVTYDSALAGGDGVSMNRSPDASATGSFVLHTALGSRLASPGSRADGSPF